VLRIAEIAQSRPRNPGVLVFRPQANGDPNAWKNLVGHIPVSARFEPLPEATPRWGALLASTLFQTVVVGLVIMVPVLFPGSLINRTAVEAILLAPQTEITLPQMEPAPHPKVLTPSPAVLQSLDRQPPVQLIAPRLLSPAVRKPAPVKSVDAPTLNETSAELNFQGQFSQPDRPGEPVKIGTLSPGNDALLESSKPAAQVQTGGFGDPNGLPGENTDKRGNVVRAGFSSLPSGPGYGNVSGGASGTRAGMAKAGFGDDAEIPGIPGIPGRAGGVVKSGGFDAAAVASPAPKVKEASMPPAVQPVVILEKPNPVYSDEARKLGLEGEVLVEVIFLASGEVRVLRVAHGLGHGLDEAAMRAAQQIRFKPALQNGKPVDFAATVYIQFELAF
jgi:TonB family protein